ncbi:MAG: DUF2630 family protein [Burkholderiaceae bacterium]
MNDKSVLQHITELVEEERRLVADNESPEAKAEKLRHVGEQLDQCWDLLRQRRAKREFGEDPESAQPRDVDTVERYTG